MLNINYYTEYKSPIGTLCIVSDGYNLKSLQLKNNYTQNFNVKNNNLPIFKRTKTWLDNYFKGEKQDIISLPLKPDGTLFCQAIWNILSTVPYGTITTYKELAYKFAQIHGVKYQKATQAIGCALKNNPIIIIIPCHRVVGTNGNLTGYSAGGVTNKLKLLQIEGIDTSWLK